MTGPTVLVVDDDPVIVRLLGVTFSMEDFTVITAEDGADGIASAVSDRPDAVVTDIMMPRVDGLELVRTLKANPATSAIPVVVLSAKAQTADVRAGEEAGADAYVTKPFEPFDLIDQVRKLLPD